MVREAMEKRVRERGGVNPDDIAEEWLFFSAGDSEALEDTLSRELPEFDLQYRVHFENKRDLAI